MIKCKKCGGSMNDIDVDSDNESYAYEKYECTSCGAKGSMTYYFANNQKEKRGAVA